VPSGPLSADVSGNAPRDEAEPAALRGETPGAAPGLIHRRLAWLGSGPTRSASQQSKPFGFFDLHGKLAFYIVTSLRYVGKLVPVKVEHEEANSR
jgi:hypothetical protein